jgi:hypothetical protein
MLVVQVLLVQGTPQQGLLVPKLLVLSPMPLLAPAAQARAAHHLRPLLLCLVRVVDNL